MARKPVWERAAGAYARLLSTPQLFVEGNHRTGTLVMSYLLVQAGEPPFVLTARSAAAYFAVSVTIRHTPKHGVPMWLHIPFVRRRLAALLRRDAQPRHLVR